MAQLSVGIIGTKAKIDPLLGYNYIDFMLVQLVYQTLVRFSQSGDVTGNLAESWSISPDGLTYKFKIKKDACFSDGSPLQSQDVIFSLSRHGWPNSKSIVQGYLNDLIVGFKGSSNGSIAKGFKIINDHTFEIKLIHPYPAFIYILSMPSFSIVPHDEFKLQKNMGSGPLQIQETGTNWTFEHNKKYHGPNPNMREIFIETFPDSNSAIKALTDRKLDVILNLPMTTENIAALPEGYSFKPTESLTYQHIFVNSKRSISRDLRMQLGLLMGKIAREDTTDQEFFHPIATFIPPGIMEHTYYQRSSVQPNETLLKQEIKKANRAFRLIIPKQRMSESFIHALKLKLGGVSDQIQVDELELQLFREELSSGNYDFTAFAYVGNFPDPDGFIDSIRAGNIPGVNVDSNTLFHELLSLKNETDMSIRIKEYQKALIKFENQWTIFPLFQVKLQFVTSNSIQLPKTKFRYEAELWNFLWGK